MYYVENQRSMATATDGCTNDIWSLVQILVTFFNRAYCAHVPCTVVISDFSVGRYTYIDRMRLYRFHGHSQFIALDSFEFRTNETSKTDWIFCEEYMDFRVSNLKFNAMCDVNVCRSLYSQQCTSHTLRCVNISCVVRIQFMRKLDYSSKTASIHSNLLFSILERISNSNPKVCLPWIFQSSMWLPWINKKKAKKATMDSKRVQSVHCATCIRPFHEDKNKTKILTIFLRGNWYWRCFILFTFDSPNASQQNNNNFRNRIRLRRCKTSVTRKLLLHRPVEAESRRAYLELSMRINNNLYT